jgi:hypothetical protein
MFMHPSIDVNCFVFTFIPRPAAHRRRSVDPVYPQMAQMDADFYDSRA